VIALGCVYCLGRHTGGDRLEVGPRRRISATAAHQVASCTDRLRDSDPLCRICSHRWDIL